VLDSLEAYVREGARRMLAAAFEEEVTGFLGRGRYERGKPYRHYRNGHHPARELTVGVGAVEVRVPRVADVPPDVAPDGFQSRVVERYQRSSKATQELFVRLYLEGLATGDFEPVFRELVGETAALPANSVVRLKERWGAEYEAWRQRPLAEPYAYIWSDGIYLGAGGEAERTALLCVLGARQDGTKELLALELGYRENTESWAGVLRSVRDRGLAAPLVAIGDGALGLWAALREVFPTTAHQRCWNHRVLNVQAKLPQRLGAEARRRLRTMAEAESRAECERLRDVYIAELRAEGQASAAETVLRDWADLVTFYALPEGALGTPAGLEPDRVDLQWSEVADRRNQTHAAARDRAVPRLQGNATTWPQLASPQWRREPDRPGSRRLRLPRRHPATQTGARTGRECGLVTRRAGRLCHNSLA